MRGRNAVKKKGDTDNATRGGFVRRSVVYYSQIHAYACRDATRCVDTWAKTTCQSAALFSSSDPGCVYLEQLVRSWLRYQSVKTRHKIHLTFKNRLLISKSMKSRAAMISSSAVYEVQLERRRAANESRHQCGALRLRRAGAALKLIRST